MVEGFNPVRHSVIEDKNPREIVMLVGDGCKWRKCRFCDYHLDSSLDIEANYKINKEALEQVTGLYNELEVINCTAGCSACCETGDYPVSQLELEYLMQGFASLDNTLKLEVQKNIKTIHFECHYMHKDDVKDFKKSFQDLGVECIIKLGLETFDYNLRENVLVKGIEEKAPKEIAKYFDEINLLQGIAGQTAESMINDIETGLKYFKRICVNIMIENGMPIKPDEKVIKEFLNEVYPKYKDNKRVDILLNNTDFGVGENKE